MKALTLVLVAACGGGGINGEPQMGTAMVTFGSTTRMMAVGSAITDSMVPGNMLIQLGDNNVSCSTNLDDSLVLNGMFATLSVPQTTGTDATADVGVIYATGNNIDGSYTSGMVTVDSIDTRVAGSFAFMTTGGSNDDTAISASGTFDVKKCF